MCWKCFNCNKYNVYVLFNDRLKRVFKLLFRYFCGEKYEEFVILIEVINKKYLIGIKKWVCNILYVFKYVIWYRKYL